MRKYFFNELRYLCLNVYIWTQLFLKENAGVPPFEVNCWYWRSLWRYSLILTNFRDETFSPWPFHCSKRNGGWMQVCDHSKAICMLSTPPKSCHEGINHSLRSSSQWNLPSDCVTSPPGKGSMSLTNYYNTVWRPARIVSATCNLDIFWSLFCFFGRFSPGGFELC
jgi:hypothetical protein